MNTAVQSTQDHQLQQDVEEALRWAPEIDSAAIGVSAHDGVVTLSGQVPTYWQRAVAGKYALRTRGVAALANEIAVHHQDVTTDVDVAGSARQVLRWNSAIPRDSVKVDVEDNVVTLTGQVDWNYQREMAEHLVAPLVGVRTVKNRITLSPRRHASATETQAQVRRAILRQATTDARHVNVAADGTRVVLTGTVSSFAEKRQAEIAAWAAPNVDHVDNKIVVGPVD